MTYNFDADRWFENRKALLDEALASGKLDPESHRRAIEDLERRYEEMCRRLDGTYQLPPDDSHDL